MTRDNSPHARIEAYGAVLTRVTQADIEQVRLWRNDPAVSGFMESRDIITSEMQARWFASLDPQRQFFYVVHGPGGPAGVANLKNLDVASATAEGGIYLADPALRDGYLGLAAMLAMYDHGFERLGLGEITAHIRSDNPRAIRVNQALGFRREPGQEQVRNQAYRLLKADYFAKAGKFRSFLGAAQAAPAN